MLTEKIEELLLARMHPVLEHRSFSLVVRFRFLKQNLGFVIAYQPRAAVRVFYDKIPRETTQRTSNWLLEHLPHHRMIGADDGSSIFDAENLLLDEAEFLVVGRITEEFGDSFPDITFVHPGGMGMTRRDFISQSFGISPFLGPGVKGVPVYICTSLADCNVSEYLYHFSATKGIVPPVSRESDDSGNQLSLNITNVTLARTGEDSDDAALCRKGDTKNRCHCH